MRSLLDARRLAARRGVGARVRAAGRRARHRVGAHLVARAGHEQLGTGADEAVEGEEHARRVGGPQLGEHVGPADGRVGFHDELAGQHDLAGGLVAQLVSHRHQRGLPVLGRAGTGHREAGGPRPLRWLPGGRQGGDGVFGGDEVGDPPGAVVGSAHDDAGNHQLTRADRVERERAEGHRPGTGHAHLVVDLDGGQDVVHRGGCGGRVTRRNREAQRLTLPGQAAAAAGPHDAVGAGELDQVHVGVEPAGPGDQRGGGAAGAHRGTGHHSGRSRVPNSSWEIPPENRERLASANPAWRRTATNSSGGGR